MKEDTVWYKRRGVRIYVVVSMLFAVAFPTAVILFIFWTLGSATNSWDYCTRVDGDTGNFPLGFGQSCNIDFGRVGGLFIGLFLMIAVPSISLALVYHLGKWALGRLRHRVASEGSRSLRS